jgi:two-component system sensor histidine kinase MprB
MSLRWKVALSLALVGMVATVSVGLLGYRSTSSRLLDEVDSSLEDAATLLRVGTTTVRIPDRSFLDVYSVRRLDATGDVTATSFRADVPVDPTSIDTLIADPEATHIGTVASSDGERYRVLSRVAGVGGFQIARSLAETDAVLDDLRRRTTALVVLVSVLAAALGWLVASSVAGPLRRLARAADQVRSSGDLDVEVPDGGSENDEVGRLRSAFRGMLDALATSRAEQQRLVQDAGHELRTPLTSLRTNLAVLRRHADMPEPMKQGILDDLDGEVTELTDLVNELVAAASGSLADQPAEPVRLAEVATVVAERVARRRSRQVDVTVTADAVALVPRSGIERAITNVIDNACKFDRGAAPIEVVVEVTGAPGSPQMVGVRVLDRGPGIPDDELDRVFDRFHRAESTRAMPGSGLGLSIVRDVVEAHGGEVVAANRPDGGAEVGFRLPVGA